MPRRRPSTLHSQIVIGPPCIYLGHVRSKLDSRAPRYKDTGACVHCIKRLTQPGLKLDVNEIAPSMRFAYLDFWALIDITDPDLCWNAPVQFLGTPARYTEAHAPAWMLDNAPQISVSKLAFWFSWGDIGTVPIRKMCDNKLCCNPLHLRASWVPHLFHRDKIGIDFLIHSTLKQPTFHDYLRERLRKKPVSYGRLSEIAPGLIDRLKRQARPPEESPVDKP